MREEDRPSPEKLLEAIQHEERGRNKGRLKIFLGMAAGVGKTYTMLEEARLLKRDGIDIVVGVVETHGRQETALLLQELKIIPKKTIIHKDIEFHEFDLDAILTLHPQLVILDELAHTNVPGSRHSKRWQDVTEILENGIDVYTTLNVQHIDSLNDIVEGITGISVKETVPDLIIEAATFIQLVDLTPDELLQRLKEGKVYLEGQSQIAAQHFFQKDRLTALREIVLRYTAEKVDRDLLGMVSSVGRSNGWRPREKLLVAVSPSPHSQKLIRTTRRIASNLDASWIVVHVNDGRILEESDNNKLDKNLTLARELGAEVITTNDPDIADGIQRIARQRGVTQIVVGRPPKRRFFNFFQKYTLLDRLARECSDIDIHVIRQEPWSKSSRKKVVPFTIQKDYFPYLSVFFFVCLLSGINWLILPYIGYKVAGTFFLLGILFLSLFFRKGPIFFATCLYAMNWLFFFVPPQFQFQLLNQEDTAILVLYFLTAVVTGALVDRAREHKDMLAKREESTQALYDIVRKIASPASMEETFESVKARLARLVNGSFEILVKKIDNGLIFEKPLRLLSDEKEKSAAIWVFENEKEAGWSTSTLPSSKNLYIPLKGFHEVVGVLVYRPKMNRALTTEEKNFLYTVGQQLSNYLERTFSEEKERQVQHRVQEEKIYQNVLKSISTGLQSPLSTIQEAIQKAVQTLKYISPISENKGVERQIYKIEDSSTSLLHMLNNVSSMAKLSGNLIPINKKKQPIKQLIDVCAKKMSKNLENRTLKVNVQEKLPQVSFDFSLIEILLQNLLQNAIEYSPSDSQIEIEAKQEGLMIVLSVLDEGKGIPPESLEAIFEKFYRLPNSECPGLGLGLSIAKKIAEIHHGYLTAENRSDKGAKVSLYLPIEND